jgi:hypothetical protein
MKVYYYYHKLAFGSKACKQPDDTRNLPADMFRLACNISVARMILYDDAGNNDSPRQSNQHFWGAKFLANVGISRRPKHKNFMSSKTYELKKAVLK